MAKLTAATRYMLACLLTIVALAAIAYWILRPLEWRPQLINLISRSADAFTGADRSSWLASHLYSSAFLILTTLVLVGITHGRSALKLQWIEKSTIALMALAIQIVLFYGAIYLRTLVRTVYQLDRSAAARITQLTNDKASLTRESSSWKSRALELEHEHSKQEASSPKDLPKQLMQETRVCASDILSFQDIELSNKPTTILIAVPGGQELMRKSMEDSIRYNDQAIVEFLKTFGGQIESIMRRVRPYGLDTSRLERHVAELNGIQMTRLIADDLNDLADQMDTDHIGFSRRRKGPYCPSYYTNCPQTQPPGTTANGGQSLSSTQNFKVASPNP